MKLIEMKNIGPKMNQRLNAIGIHTAEELREIGSKEAYFRLKAAYPEVCTVFLYVLQGAIDNVDYNMLTPQQKEELSQYSKSIK